MSADGKGKPTSGPKVPKPPKNKTGEEWIIEFQHSMVGSKPGAPRRTKPMGTPGRTVDGLLAAVPQPEVPGGTVTLDVADMEDVADMGKKTLPLTSRSRTAPDVGGQPPPLKADEYQPGTIVLKYESIRRLGRGGMGTVWEAYDTRLGRRVAIKFMHKKGTRQAEFNKRFEAEAKATAQFNHENIVTIYDSGNLEGTSYLVLEYLDGEPLSQKLKQRRLTYPQALQIILPVVKALVEANKIGMIHRDLKPDNIYLLKSGGVKVLDFGLAKLFSTEASLDEGGVQKADLVAMQAKVAQAEKSDSSSTHSGSSKPGLRGDQEGLTKAGMIMGTYAYMSPEQWGLGHVDHQSDIWAVGVILFEMLTGEHPFGSRATEVIMHNIARLNDPVRSVRQVVPTVPDTLDKIITKCLQKKKTHRYHSAKELLSDIELLTEVPSRKAFLTEDQSPYPGLAPFTERDANRFFGRDAEIAQFIGKLKDRPTLAVIGPSGAGKSSFARAGVIPTLRAAGSTEWDVITCRPGREPFSAVAGAMLMGVSTGNSAVTSVVEAAKEESTLAEQLKEAPGRLGAILRARARSHGRPVMLYIDQFEELFTLVDDPEERDRFATAVAGIAVDATTPVRVILSMRSDFLDRVAENRLLMEAVTRDLTILQQPTGEGLREAIIRPAELAGYAFDDESLVDEMVQSLEGETAALPLLQFAAQKLWEQRDKQRKLMTRASYEAMGGVEGALVRHADAVIQAMSSSDRVATKHLFQRLVTPEGTREVLSVAEIRGLFPRRADADRILGILTEARLLVVQSLGEEAEEARIEIVHESLITRWQTLRRWLEEGHEDSSMLAQLRDAARQWDGRGRPTGLLWTGDAVAEARLWRKRSQAVLTPMEDDFLEAAFRLDDRAARRRRLLAGAAIIIMALVTVGAIVSLLAIRRAEQKAKGQAVVAKKEAIRASRAEGQVREQMAQLKVETERAKKAEALAKDRLTQAVAARNREQKAQKDLQHSYEQLKVALDRARKAQLRAVAAGSRARKANNRFKQAAAAERRARLQAEDAQKRLARLLERERERVKNLMALRSKVIQKLPFSHRSH